MELSVIVTALVAVTLTATASIVKDREDALDLLRFQASALGVVELIRGVNQLYVGLLSEAIVDFFSTFLLWTFCVAVTPAVISRGISRVRRQISEPAVGTRKIMIVTAAVSASFMAVTVLSARIRLLPENLDMLPIYLLIFSLSVFNMVIRRDPLMVLIGLNMAENAFEPLIAELPLVQIALALGSAQFVNVIALLIIIEGEKEFGSLQLTRWRETGIDQ